MLRVIENIGNLRICQEDHTSFMDHLYRDGATFTLHAYNGADEVAHETYFTPDVKTAVERLMIHFDTYTLEAIRAGLENVTIEHDGRLISGRIAGFNDVEYFKRIDETRFFKHFTHKPRM